MQDREGLQKIWHDMYGYTSEEDIRAGQRTKVVQFLMNSEIFAPYWRIYKITVDWRGMQGSYRSGQKNNTLHVIQASGWKIFIPLTSDEFVLRRLQSTFELIGEIKSMENACVTEADASRFIRSVSETIRVPLLGV